MWFIIPVSVILLTILAMLVYKRKLYIWLGCYIKQSLARKNEETIREKHIILCFVDHFEPHHGRVNDEKAGERMQVWTSDYPKFASQYRDSDGNVLKHTWFYPYDELEENELKQLSALCRQGYGEVEFHLHHKNDTEESLKNKLLSGLKKFNEYGINITEDNKVAYGFIHGNWALNNSVIKKGENFCGVNNELTILKETGCYADFTFPAYMSDSQPAMVNKIFYAKSSPEQPKGHNKGKEVTAGSVHITKQNELMIIPGPMAFNWRHRKWGVLPTVEDGNIHAGNLFDASKVQLWEKANIHVKGKPEWVFIKLFTHGAPEKNHNAVFGEDAKQLFDFIDSTFKNGNRRLHYVTAREMYNIIKAAEAGKQGSPDEFRNYSIKPYMNTQ